MEVGVRLIGALQLFVSLLLWPVYFMLSRRERTRLPAMKSPYLRMSAQELATRIRTKQAKSREVVEAFICRIREVNPILNGLVEDRFAKALQDAEEADEWLATTKLDPGQIEKQKPLFGVPFTVKESCGLAGLSHSVGSKPRAGIKAVENGGSVDRMIKAGGIPLCVTTTPEYCMSWETTNLITGTTNNPYNVLKTSGGSSGGEGAFISAGASVLGIGSDIAGSIRIPSMFNGIYGHKPSPGVVPLSGHFPNSTDKNFLNFLVCGPMTRYVDDLKVAMKIMAGENAALLKLDEEVDVSKLNIYYKEDAGFSLVTIPVDWEIKRGIREAVSFLKKSHKCNVKEAELKELEISVEISAAVFLGMEGIPDIRDASPAKEKGSLYSEILNAFLGESDYSLVGLMFMLIVKHNLFIPKSKYPYYCKLNEELRRKFNEMLKDDGVFIYPTHPVSALYHNQSFSRTAGIMYTMIFNTLQLPCTHVPIGLDRNGHPIGFQVIAGEKQDRLCLAVAKALDAKFGGWVPPPMVS